LVCYASSGKEGNRMLPEHAYTTYDPKGVLKKAGCNTAGDAFTLATVETGIHKPPVPATQIVACQPAAQSPSAAAVTMVMLYSTPAISGCGR